jgi:glycerate-2-kinase
VEVAIVLAAEGKRGALVSAGQDVTTFRQHDGVLLPSPLYLGGSTLVSTACRGGCGVNISFCWSYLQKLENKGVRGIFQFVVVRFSFRGVIGCESDSGMIVRLGRVILCKRQKDGYLAMVGKSNNESDGRGLCEPTLG